jgi:hypothetical protein
MNKRGPAAGVADDKNRIFNFDPSKLRKQDMIQEHEKSGHHGPDHEKQNHETKKQKMFVEFKQFPACFQPLQV